MLIPDDLRIIDLTVGQLRQILREGGTPLRDLGQMPAANTRSIDSVPIEKLSELTGWSKSCIYKKCSLRQIPHNKVGKELRFNIVEINAWIEQKKRKTGDELVGEFEASQKARLKKVK